MSGRRRQWPAGTVLILVAGAILGACSGAPASSSAASAQGSLGAGSSQLASSTPTVTAAPSSGTLSVDLVFSGTVSVTATGHAGQCTLGRSTADGSIVFGFGATDADYPGLADGFYLSEDPGTHLLGEKWVNTLAPSVGDLTQGVTFSPDHKSVTLDADLPGGLDSPEHVTGTISCP